MTTESWTDHQPAQTPLRLLGCSYVEYGPIIPRWSSSFVLHFLNNGWAAYAQSMKFGDRLRELRESKKMSQAELGRGLGEDGKDSSKAVVSGWEKNRHFPKVDQLIKICSRLGCSADFLCFGVQARWPLTLVEQARYDRLDEKQKGHVETRMLQAIEECERQQPLGSSPTSGRENLVLVGKPDDGSARYAERHDSTGLLKHLDASQEGEAANGKRSSDQPKPRKGSSGRPRGD